MQIVTRGRKRLSLGELLREAVARKEPQTF
jgi:hypothetical protein